MTANAAGPGAYILTCDGDNGEWVATINAALPTANEQIANKEYVDSAVAAGSLAGCADNDAGLCALETNRADSDPQFTPENIANGVNILGVTGTYSGDGNLQGPEDCPEIGDRCTSYGDTIIFAGFHPLTHEHLFMVPTDLGNYKWKIDALGAGIRIDPISHVDGLANHHNVQIALSNLPAMEACANLNLGGKTWYLPSIYEINYMYHNRARYLAKAPENGFIDFPLYAQYWSSTEAAPATAYIQNFDSGGSGHITKTNTTNVRCLTR